MHRKRGDSNKRVSNKRLRALGWAPRYPTFADAHGEMQYSRRSCQDRDCQFSKL